MKATRGPLLALALGAAGLLALGGSIGATENEKESATLSYKSFAKWTIDLPQETFTPVNQQIPIPHAGGSGFVAAMDGPALALDTNADGKVDAKAKGTAAMLTLKGKSENGRDLVYAVRLVNEGGWKFAAGGAMTGSIKGTPVRLIDQNNNGKYDDFGADAMVLGSGDAASYLSRVVSLGGTLYNFEVNADGSEVAVSPFVGETGTLNLREGFKSQGKLESAVIASEGRDISFNLADAKKGMVVPVGEYTLVYGTVTSGTEIVHVKAGKMAPIAVRAAEESVPAWGGPITAEFSYTHENDTLTIRPTDLWFYGSAGEEYYSWVPDGAPPKFVVKDAKTNREITTARFGGC
jgi:hypothetical protein